MLLEHGASVTAEDTSKHTPLNAATKRNRHPEVIRMFLEHGACASAMDGQGNTPLHYAVEENPKLKYLVTDPHYWGAGFKMVHEASVDLEIIRMLLERGASVLSTN